MNVFEYSLDAWDWDGIPVIVEPVLIHWQGLMAGVAPWRAMERDDAVGYMRAVVSELLNEPRDADGPTREARLESSAREHGRFRRAQRIDVDSLVREFRALAVATEAALLSTGMTPQFARDALVILDADLKLASESAAVGWLDGEPLR